MTQENFNRIDTVINPTYRRILGTDAMDNSENLFGPEYFEYRRKWEEYPRKKIISEFPLHLDIESTSICDLRCRMCSTTNLPDIEKGFMDYQMFRKIIDEGADYKLPSVKINWRGEPLLHKDISKFIRYAKDKGIIEVHMNTNGLLLDEDKRMAILDSGLDRLFFSVDGVKPDTYNKIRIGSDYNTVERNILAMVDLRNQKGLKKPIISLQMVDMKETHDEVDTFIEKWKPIVNFIGIILFRNPEGLGDDKRRIEPYPTVAFPCSQLWQRILINWGGNIHMCCGDHQGKIILGHFKTMSIHEAWRSKKLNEIRKWHIQYRFDKIPVCDRCEINKFPIQGEWVKRKQQN